MIVEIKILKMSEKGFSDLEIAEILEVDYYKVQAVIKKNNEMLNGKLHFWEEIMSVMITNRELLDKLKEEKIKNDNY